MRKINFLLLFFLITLTSTESYSWGSQGHKIVAEIAYQYLDKATQDSVKKYLGDMSFQNAATWMDDMRSDPNFNYMKPWHYINVEKDKTFVKSTDENIVNELNKTIDELQRSKANKELVNLDIKIIFHIVGDLHQPLHVGYGTDKGGNSIDVIFQGKKSNLHKVWDSEMIYEKKITAEECLELASKLSAEEIREIQKIDVIKWMDESRSFLANVYDFKEGIIDQNYINMNTPIIEKQLTYAGLRLANILRKTFSK